jgi:hypothetical protein
MSRTTEVWRDGVFYERGTEPRAPSRRSSLPAPAIRTDGMAPIRSHADGKIYDGKGAYYRSVKEAGCEIVGDDKAPFERRPEFVPHGSVAGDIKRAIEELS